MISLTPLERTLRDKGMNYTQLGGMLGTSSGDISNIIKNIEKNTARTEVIERICNVLNCNIQDVIEYTQEVVDRYVSINWERFLKLCEEKGYTRTSIAVKLNLSKSYIRMAIQRNSKLKSSLLQDICNLLNCSKEDLIIS